MGDLPTPKPRENPMPNQVEAEASELERIADMLEGCCSDHVLPALRPGSGERVALIQVARGYRDRASRVRAGTAHPVPFRVTDLDEDEDPPAGPHESFGPADNARRGGHHAD